MIIPIHLSPLSFVLGLSISELKIKFRAFSALWEERNYVLLLFENTD